MSIRCTSADSAIEIDTECYEYFEWNDDMPPSMDLIRSYYIPAVTDLVTMNGARDEMLTSFAENPTKSVEKDALVESQLQFTRPDQVEKAVVEKPKWPWTKGKQNENMSRYLVFVALITILVVFFMLVAVGYFFLWSNDTSQAASEPQKFYTLPTVNYEKENRRAQAGLILPEVLNKEETTEAPFEEISENFVEEHSVSLEEQEHGSENDDVTHDEPIGDEVTNHDVTDTATFPTEETTTAQKTTPKYLHFHESVDDRHDVEGCLQLQSLGSPSGVYTTSNVLGYRSYCDMDTTSGGWTVIQRRAESEVNFHRGPINEYKKGFGNLTGSHWLGLNQLAYIAPVSAPPALLRIEIQGETCDLSCSKRFPNTWVGEWKVNFGSEEDGYRMHIYGPGTGNLTFNGVDPLAGGNLQKFTTVDLDQDTSEDVNCAAFRMFGPWWHGKPCSDASLNGYLQKRSEKYEIKDKNQAAKRYFVWAFEGQTYNGYPYIIHVRRSVMLLKPDPIYQTKKI